MNLKHLEYITVLAEEGNVTRAAGRIGISQPTLTQALQKAEADLGAELFQKKGRGMSLTREGRVFCLAANKMLRIYAEAREDIEGLRRGAKGVIRLGIAPSRALFMLPAMLETFREAFPDVRMDIEELLSAQNLAKVLSGELDLGLTTGVGVQNAELNYIPAFSESVFAAAHPRLLLSCGFTPERLAEMGDVIQVEPEAVAGLPFVLLGQEQSISGLFEEYMAGRGIFPSVVSRCKSAGTGLALANHGTGAALVLSSALDYYRGVFPDLIYLTFGDDSLRRTVYVIHRTDKDLSAPEERLIQIIKETEIKHD